jgi:hypothetical protein
MKNTELEAALNVFLLPLLLHPPYVHKFTPPSHSSAPSARILPLASHVAYILISVKDIKPNIITQNLHGDTDSEIKGHKV